MNQTGEPNTKSPNGSGEESRCGTPTAWFVLACSGGYTVSIRPRATLKTVPSIRSKSSVS